LRYINNPEKRRKPDTENEKKYGALVAELLVLGQELAKAKGRLDKAKKGVVMVKRELNIS
jgi:hypothetical protein